MAKVKKFYWFKLKEDFFRQLHIKKLRKIAGGDTYTIIYLKMLLLSINSGGFISYSCEKDKFIENLALDIDEDEENVRVTVNFLLSSKILEENNDNLFLPEVPESTGSETNYAEKMRRLREAKGGNNVTPLLPFCYPSVTKCYRDIDIEKEKDIDKDKDIICDSKESPKETKTKTKRFCKPTVEEISAYCAERNNNVDPQKFFDYYEANGWKVGRNPMKDWKACVRTWERNSFGKGRYNKGGSDPLDDLDLESNPFEVSSK